MEDDAYEDDASPAAKYEAKQLFQEAYQAQLAENFKKEIIRTTYIRGRFLNA